MKDNRSEVQREWQKPLTPAEAEQRAYEQRQLDAARGVLCPFDAKGNRRLARAYRRGFDAPIPTADLSKNDKPI